MFLRTFGRTNWQVSEIGYGMWGLAGWKGGEIEEVKFSLQLSVDLGCNFFDTAWAYAEGLSEQILGELIAQNKDKKLYVATKIPPMNWKWPSKPDYKLEEVFPYEHIISYTEKSLKNLKVDSIDLQQFHVWEDAWHNNDEWKKAIEKLITDGKVKHFGISVNRWEPTNCIETLKTKMIDSVQVIYNIFDQNPEDELFPFCEKENIAVIARVPFDEGTLTGTLTKDSKFPEGDWRNTYFVPENLIPSVERADEIKKIVPSQMTMAELALRFILENNTVSTVIPGMRKAINVRNNLAVSDNHKLEKALINELKKHRWDRKPTSWSQ